MLTSAAAEEKECRQGIASHSIKILDRVKLSEGYAGLSKPRFRRPVGSPDMSFGSRNESETYSHGCVSRKSLLIGFLRGAYVIWVLQQQ